MVQRDQQPAEEGIARARGVDAPSPRAPARSPRRTARRSRSPPRRPSPPPLRSRSARAGRAPSRADREPAPGSISRAACLAGLSRSAARSRASSVAASPRPGTASEGGTSRSTTVGMPAARAISSAASAAASGSWETSVVTRAARRMKARMLRAHLRRARLRGGAGRHVDGAGACVIHEDLGQRGRGSLPDQLMLDPERVHRRAQEAAALVVGLLAEDARAQAERRRPAEVVEHDPADVGAHGARSRHVAQDRLRIGGQDARRAVHAVDDHAADADDIEFLDFARPVRLDFARLRLAARRLAPEVVRLHGRHRKDPCREAPSSPGGSVTHGSPIVCLGSRAQRREGFVEAPGGVRRERRRPERDGRAADHALREQRTLQAGDQALRAGGLARRLEGLEQPCAPAAMRSASPARHTCQARAHSRGSALAGPATTPIGSPPRSR